MLNNLEVVFVHLGEAKVRHLWKNIEHIQQHWPHHEIVLLSDSQSNLRKATKIGINSWEFELSEHLDRIFQNSKHNASFRGGFWNYSILRLFAVLEYSISNPDKTVIHFESDIAIFPNFPFETLSKLEKPAWMRFNDTHDVGAIFTVPNANQSQFLLNQLANIFSDNPNLTDMTLLNTFARLHPDRVSYLPVAESTREGLIRRDIAGDPESSLITENFHHFNGIFDSASLGMWLLGQDPRNHLGQIIRYRQLPESYIQPQQVQFGFDEVDNFLYFDNQIPIFNLHVHSKEIKYFEAGWQRAIKSRVRSSHRLSRKSKFSMGAFRKLSTDYLKRNGLKAIPRGFRRLFKL